MHVAKQELITAEPGWGTEGECVCFVLGVGEEFEDSKNKKIKLFDPN